MRALGAASVMVGLVAATACEGPAPRREPNVAMALTEKPAATQRSASQRALERSEAARDRQLAALRRAMARDGGPVSEERALYRTHLAEQAYVMATRWHLGYRHGRVLVGDPDADALDDTVLFLESELCRSSLSVANFLRSHEPNQVGFRRLVCAEMRGTRHEYPLLPRGRHLE
jgi:hypothetical protein